MKSKEANLSESKFYLQKFKIEEANENLQKHFALKFYIIQCSKVILLSKGFRKENLEIEYSSQLRMNFKDFLNYHYFLST